MKMFTKIALVSSMAISANAMAMQAMDDASLSATTGQDGINIGIGISKVEIEKLFIHDNDGLTGGSTAGKAGAIVIKGNGKTGDINEKLGVVVKANYDDAGKYLLTTRNLADLRIDSDAGDKAAGGAFINIAADVSGLDINIGEIGVTGSNAILSGLSLKTGPMSANIQLGVAPQGAMIKLDAKMLGGLEIKNLGILDNSTKTATRAAGEIFVDSIKVADANARDLSIDQKISVIGKEGTNNGYIRMVSNSGPIDNYVKGVHLGSRDAASIGDVEIQGLQTYYSPAMGQYNQGSVITISGR